MHRLEWYFALRSVWLTTHVRQKSWGRRLEGSVRREHLCVATVLVRSSSSCTVDRRYTLKFFWTLCSYNHLKYLRWIWKSKNMSISHWRRHSDCIDEQSSTSQDKRYTDVTIVMFVLRPACDVQKNETQKHIYLNFISCQICVCVYATYSVNVLSSFRIQQSAHQL